VAVAELLGGRAREHRQRRCTRGAAQPSQVKLGVELDNKQPVLVAKVHAEVADLAASDNHACPAILNGLDLGLKNTLFLVAVRLELCGSVEKNSALS